MKKYWTRSEWGARAPARSTPNFSSRYGVVLHHGGSSSPSSEADARRLVRGYQNYHINTRGWNDIAYNFLVDRWGNVYEGRGWNTRSGANGNRTYNARYLAMCVVGNSDRGDLTEDAKQALRWIRHEARTRHGFGTIVYPHSYITGSSCPGTAGRAFIAQDDWNYKEGTWFDMATKAELKEVVREVVREEVGKEVWGHIIGHGANKYASTLLSRLQAGGIDDVLEKIEELSQKCDAR